MSKRIVEDIDWTRLDDLFIVTVTFAKSINLKKGGLDEESDGVQVRYGEQLLDICDLTYENGRKVWYIKGVLKGKSKKNIGTDEIIVVIETKKPTKGVTSRAVQKKANALSKKKGAKTKKKATKKKSSKKKST